MSAPRKAGRRPANDTAPGRQEIWDAIRQQRDQFSTSSLIAATGANQKTIDDYLRCLAPGGVIERSGERSWRLIDDRGFHAPRLNRSGKPVTQGAGCENMWRSMRGLVEFSSRDLAAHSTTPDVYVSDLTAQAYCTMLMKTGYLRVIQKASPGHGRAAIYRLIRNTGPLPPQIQRVKHVFDPNTHTVHMPGNSQ